MTPKIVIKDVAFNIKFAKLSIDRNTRINNLKCKFNLLAVFVRNVFFSGNIVATVSSGRLSVKVVKEKISQQVSEVIIPFLLKCSFPILFR